MAIISAEIEANGWVLSVVVSGAAGDFADYALDPGGTPRLTLSSSHGGFEPSGGAAVAATLVRALVGTRPLRLSVDLGDPSARVIDEVDAGGGNRRVRIALSETVYATDSSLSLALLAGWRTGESTASGISVTNNSTVAAPIPIMRWTVLHHQLETSPVFRLSLLVFSHHPVGFQPVAGVKFTLTDGTDTITVWKTALETCPYGDDGLRCYTTEIDASTLQAGRLRGDAEVYPWLGVMRSTDPAGTRVVSGLAGPEQPLLVGAENPLVLINDPAGTVFKDRWVMIDPVNGSTTASTAMVGATLAAAKAVTTKAADTSTALAAVILLNKTMPATLGQPAFTRAYGGSIFVLPAGVTRAGTTGQLSGSSYAGAPLVLMGDPADPDPRANCIYQAGDVASDRLNVGFHVDLIDLTIEVGGTTLLPNASGGIQMKNVNVRNKSGNPGPYNISQSQSTRGWRFGVVNATWTSGQGLTGSNHRAGLIRNIFHTFTVTGYCIVKTRWSGSTTTAQAVQPWGHASFPEGFDDNILAYGDYRETYGRIYSFPTGGGSVPDGNLYRRTAMVGNVFERVGTDPGPFMGIGEGQWGTFAYNIIEANTFAGERANFIYADPPHSVVADTYTRTNTIYANRLANNAFDWNPNKTDTFNSPAASALRGASIEGYREQIGAEAWSNHMGVDREGNYDSQQAPGYASAFDYWFLGIRSATANLAAGWEDNKSNSGDGLGGGDYTPTSGSPLLGRAMRGQSDVDFVGTARPAAAAAGAFEAVGAPVNVGLEPEDARHDHLSGSPGFGGAVSLAPANSFHGYGGFDPLVAVLMGLVPAQGWLMVSAADAAVGVQLGLAPAVSGPVMLASSPLLSFGGLTISAASGRLVISGDVAGLEATLVEAGVPGVRVLRVGAEQRVFFAPLG